MTEHDPHDGNGLPDDRELEELLARRSELSRLHREGAQEQAPPQLDAKVLETAREELRRAKRPRRLLRWDNPLALAASALLVVGLAWLTQRQAPQPAVTEAAPAPAAPVAVVADQAVLAGAAAESNRETGELKDERKKERQVAAPVAAPAASKSEPPPATNGPRPMPRPFPLPQAPPREERAPAPAQRDTAAVTPDVAAPAPFPAQSAGLSAAPQAGAASAEPAERASAAQDAQQKPEQGYSDKALQSVPAPQPPPAAMRAYGSAPIAAAPAPAPLPANPAASNLAKAVSDPCASAQRAPAQKQAQPERQLDAPAWLEQVRQLRQTDEVAARAELACFSARWPRVEVPGDLRSLLPQR